MKGDLIVFLTGIIALIAIFLLGVHSISLLGKEFIKELDAAVEDFENPNVLSEHINSVETKTFTLLNIDNNYYIGKGFIDGDLYYIFQVKEETDKRGYETAPVINSEFIYDGKNIVEVTKINITEKYRSRVNNQIETREIDKYHMFFIF